MARRSRSFVPTLREVANLRPLAWRVAGALADSGIAWELLLVDDDSRAGSEAVAAELGKRLPVRMAVRRRVRADLSHAVLDGIALGRYDRIVVMDADLSHPPERIPDLLAGLDAGCDMVVGSRYAASATTRATSAGSTCTSSPARSRAGLDHDDNGPRRYPWGWPDAAVLGPLALYVATLPRTVVFEDDVLLLMAGTATTCWLT